MRKVFALFMAAACVLGATVFSTPKAQTEGEVAAVVNLSSQSSAFDIAGVFVHFSGNTSVVDVSYFINRYKGKNYTILDKSKRAEFVVIKSDYSHSWSLSGVGAKSMIAGVSYQSADETRSCLAKKSL